MAFLGNEALHPNACGHELLKNAVLAKTNYFTQEMPSPKQSPIPQPDEFAFLDAPKSGGIISELFFHDAPSNRILMLRINQVITVRQKRATHLACLIFLA